MLPFPAMMNKQEDLDSHGFGSCEVKVGEKLYIYTSTGGVE